MINSLLFSPAEADRLNNRVKSEIADHLFLFINYSPNYLIPPSVDAKYRLAVENLYSIFKDTAWVILNFSEIYTGKSKKKSIEERDFSKDVDTKTIRSIFQIISDLRTIHGHTSATTDIMLTGRCEQWFSNFLKYKKPQTIDDYEILTNELKKYADIIVTECEKFIDKVKKSKNKAAIVGRWEDAVIKRYTLSQDMFRQAIYKYYYIQNSSTGVFDTSLVNGCVNRIITSYYYFDYQILMDKVDIPSIPIPIKVFLKKQAAAISKTRTNKLSEEIKDLKLTCLDELFLSNLNADNYKKIHDYFFKNDLEVLIREQLTDSDKKSLDIDDLVIAILENTKNEIVLPNEKKLSLKRFKINIS